MFDNNTNVYLCVLTLKNTFECKKFNTYKEADYYYNIFYYNNNEFPKSTMIPICKYTPSFLHEKILNYKLGKLFISTKITN